METKNSSLKIKTKEGIQYITLNRPEKRNAINPQMISELLSVFKEKQWDPSTRVIMLSGAGKVFCSGADLKWMADESLFTREELENLFSLFEAIALCALPVVTLVQGFAVGGGLGLLSVSDVVIAEENTQFLFSETKLGLVPSVISPFVLKKIGLSQAKFLMLSALPFSAQQAKEIGLIHFIGSQEKCDNFLEKLLKHFKTLDGHAVSETKKWLNSLGSMSFSRANPFRWEKEEFSDNQVLDEEYQSRKPSRKKSLKTESVRIIHSARNNESAKQRIKNLFNRR